MTTKDLYDARIRKLGNMIQRMLNGEYNVKNPKDFIGVWNAEILDLDAKIFNLSLK